MHVGLLQIYWTGEPTTKPAEILKRDGFERYTDADSIVDYVEKHCWRYSEKQVYIYCLIVERFSASLQRSWYLNVLIHFRQ